MAYEHIPLIALPPDTCEPYAPQVSSIGRNLKDIREERQKTQDEIAKECGVPQNQWSKWESGKAQPKIRTLLRLAMSLKVPLNRLVRGVNKEFDLIWQNGEQQSVREGALANVPAAARVELDRLNKLVNTYQTQARKVLALVDDLDDAATTLEELGEAEKRTPRRVRRARKAS